MQFHYNGYVSNDPRIKEAAGVGLNRPEELPEKVDVLIIGAGPAGMMTAAQLAQFPNITTRVVDRRPGRLQIGQADGIQARSVETFQAFGFAERIIAEAYEITEMAFWKPDPCDPSRIVRAARTLDDEHGISEFPHLIVNQARVLDYFAEVMAHSPTRNKPDYGYEFVGLEIGEGQYPVMATLERVEGEHAGEQLVVRAKYVVGSDGARSKVRAAIGATMQGDQSNHAWGVMDVLADTDFPDIRLKCAIQSGGGGNILHIPREGGHLFRMYVDLGEVPIDNKGAVRDTPIETIIATAKEIVLPYELDVKHVAWHSVYEVGHRVTDRFDDVGADETGTKTPHVFITGDACHTHSAKAGQGMNVSMQDGFNLAWKLGHVLEGRAPESLLATYTAERQAIAQDLINFDREWSTMMAKKPEEFDHPSELEEFYVRTAEFPFGFMTQYPPALLIGASDHQGLANGYPIGKRFKSAAVVRACDSTPQHLGHLAAADGRWRIYVFADAPRAGEASGVARLGDWLSTSPDSPLLWAPEGADEDAWFDVKVIYQQGHTEVNVMDAPAAFRPVVGKYRVRHLEKVFGVAAASDIFSERGISRDGAMVVVRPDQYVAHVLPLEAVDELAEFFKPIFGR